MNVEIYDQDWVFFVAFLGIKRKCLAGPHSYVVKHACTDFIIIIIIIISSSNIIIIIIIIMIMIMIMYFCDEIQ